MRFSRWARPVMCPFRRSASAGPMARRSVILSPRTRQPPDGCNSLRQFTTPPTPIRCFADYAFFADGKPFGVAGAQPGYFELSDGLDLLEHPTDLREQRRQLGGRC